MTMFIRKHHSFTAIGCIIMLTCSASAAPDAATIKTEIVGMPVGTSIEIQLKDQQKLRGARGAVQTLNSRSWRFEDVASVKHLKARSHTGRNILIGVGIGVGAVAIVIIALAKHGGYL